MNFSTVGEKGITLEQKNIFPVSADKLGENMILNVDSIRVSKLFIENKN